MATKEIGLLKIGDKIEIYRKESDKKESYPSKVLDILENDEFIIIGPIKKYRLIFLHKDEIVTVASLIEKKGKYEFDAKVLKRQIGRLYKIYLQKVSDIRKKQLREFFRFEISIPVIKRMSIIKDEIEETLVENCKTKDISAGGLKLLTNYSHNIGDVVECEFKIEEKTVLTKAKVIRIESVDAFDYKYSMGVQFMDISENERDNIVKFIFSRQRALREKGMI